MKSRLALLFLFSIGFFQFLVCQNAAPLSADDKKAAVERIGTLLIDNYVFPDVAQQCADHLKQRLAEGAFGNSTDDAAFAQRLTEELQRVSHDKHMRVRPDPPRPAGEPRDPLLDNIVGSQRLAEQNYGLAGAEVLDGNIGLLDIRFFPATDPAAPTVVAAMKILENVDALIVDLRKNGGGNPDLIRFYCSYFFPPNTHLNSLYWRQGDRTQEFRTLESIDGKRRPDLPVFILTSHRTFSGGEEFAYNFQSRKRATLVGETTGGGANPGGTFPVNPRLFIFIPTGRAINPITHTNWEGTGVVPDIDVAADKALEVCLPKAREAAEAYRAARQEELSQKLEPIRAALKESMTLMAAGKKAEAGKTLSDALGSGVKAGLVTEGSLNALGYEYMGQDKLDLALAVFAFNVGQFPQSSNVYDSYGEALMKAGRTAEAIANYQKSVDLDPTNENAKQIIEKMRKQ